MQKDQIMKKILIALLALSSAALAMDPDRPIVGDSTQQDSVLGYGFYEIPNITLRKPRGEDVGLAIPNFTTDSSLFAIFDGHGGKDIADYAAQHLPGYLREALASTPDTKEALKKAVLMTNESLKTSELKDKAQSMGTTAIIALIKNNGPHKDLFVSNTGNSRAILSSNGKAIPLSEDQTPERADEADRIRKAGGSLVKLTQQADSNWVPLPEEKWHLSTTPLRVANDPETTTGSLETSRAIGDFQFTNAGIIAEPEILHRRLEPTDEFIVLTSDGLFNSSVGEPLNNQSAINYFLQALKYHQEHKTKNAATQSVENVLRYVKNTLIPQDDLSVYLIPLKFL